MSAHPLPRHQAANRSCSKEREREFFIATLLVRIHFIIVMIRWTGLARWEFEFPFPGSLTSASAHPSPRLQTANISCLKETRFLIATSGNVDIRKPTSDVALAVDAAVFTQVISTQVIST